MFNKDFSAYQQKLYEVYDFLEVARWVLAAIAFSASGYFSVQIEKYHKPDNGWGPGSLWFGIAVLAVSTIARYFLREKLKTDLWNAYVQVSGDEDKDVTERFYEAIAGPVVAKKAAAIRVERMITGHHMGRPTCFQELHITYEQRSTTTSKPTYSFDYLVLSVKLDQAVPHIFIDGKSQNKKTYMNKNLWSLTKKLDPSQKMQELEGDFSKYFDVYAAHRSHGGISYQEEVDALRVLTPDAMLALRDNGYEFDYELHGQTLYVIREPVLLTTDEFDAFIQALEAALTELLPQVTMHRFEIDGAELAITESPFDLDIVMKSFFIACKYILVGLVFGAVGAMVGSL